MSKLVELQKLCDEATSGPWIYQHWPMENSHQHYITDNDGDRSVAMPFADDTDCRFIVAARTYMPLLLEIATKAQSYLEGGRVQELAEALAKLENHNG